MIMIKNANFFFLFIDFFFFETGEDYYLTHTFFFMKYKEKTINFRTKELKS